MNEDLHIKAFEILERDLSFNELNEDERSVIIDAFGSETAYQRMRGVKNLAFEEDPIMAPSLRMETDLLREFKSKYSAKESSEEGIWTLFFGFLKKPFVRYAIPMFVLIFGLIWFLNQSLLESHTETIAQTKEVGLEQDDYDEKINTENELTTEDEGYDQQGITENGSLQNEWTSSNSFPSITEDLIAIPEESEEEFAFEPVDESNEKDEVKLNDRVNKELASVTMDNKEGVKSAVQEELETDFDADQLNNSDTSVSFADQPLSNVITTDDAMGNAVESLQEISIEESKSKRYKKPGSYDKYSASVIQSGVNDKLLHQFLYATY